MLDTRKNLEAKTSTELLVVVKAAGEIAGVMAVRLVHDHLLRLNVERYKNVMLLHVNKINKEAMRLQKVRLLTFTNLRMTSKHLSPWICFARRFCLVCVRLLKISRLFKGHDYIHTGVNTKI